MSCQARPRLRRHRARLSSSDWLGQYRLGDPRAGTRVGCTGLATSPRACSPRLGGDRSWKEMTLLLSHSCKPIRPMWRIAFLEPR